MKRTPLKRSTIPLKRTALKKRSTKQAKIESEHYKIKQQMLEDGQVCQASKINTKDTVFDSTCSGQLDLDEILPRGRGGSATDTDNVQLLCRYHHVLKHDYPLEAYDLGLTRKATK